MTQPSLNLQPRDSHVVVPAEIRRLTKQSRAILARLQAGPASNKELAQIALNYRARISDIRAAGYRIPPPIENRAIGYAVYQMEREA